MSRLTRTVSAAAAAVLGAGVVVAMLAPWDSEPGSDGPLVAPATRQGSGFPRDAGEPVGFAGVRFYNAGAEPAVLDGLSLVDPDPALRVVGVLAAQEPEGGGVQAYPGFPPSPRDVPTGVAAFPDLEPLDGYVVPAQPGADLDTARMTQLVVGLESTEEEGRITLQSFRVRYHVGDRRYELVVPYAVAICTPRAAWEGVRPCGSVEGPFLPEDDERLAQLALAREHAPRAVLVRQRGRTLLQERAQALLALGIRSQLGRDPRGLLRLRAFSDEPLRGARGLRPGGEQVLDHQLDGSVEIVGDLVDKADSQGCLGVEALAGEEVAPRRPGPDAGKDERRDHRGDDPEPHLGEPEHSVGCGQDDVGASHDARSAAEGEALHPRDDRSGAAVNRLEHAEEAQRVLDILVVGKVDRRSLPLDVGAGAEGRALARENDRSGIADVGERVRQLRDQGGVERIPALGLGDRDAQHGVLAVDPQRGHSPESIRFES